MNYTTLFGLIKSYVENDFPNQDWTNTAGTGTATTSGTAQINTFIQQAEQRIFNSVQLPDFRKNVIGNTTTGNKYLNVPTDWLATFSLAAVDPVTGAQSYLLNKDVEYIRECYPVPTVTGTPKYYAIFDDTTFILGPTPDDDYDMELHYFYYPQSITASQSGTSWLGDNFDSVLLYGSLLEAYTFMKGEADVIQNYMARYNEALAMLKQLGEGKDRQDTYRTMQARIPVR
jgi:hypothetical protein